MTGLKTIKDPAPAFVGAAYVYARYGVGETTIWRWCRDGRFPAPVRTPGGVRRWRVSDLEAWERQLAEQP